MDPNLQNTLITAGVGLSGAVIGAIGAWIGASSTNRIQRELTEKNLNLQKQIAADNLQLQKHIAESNSELQRELAKENTRNQSRVYLDNLVLKMLEFMIEHPHLEKDEYCQSYPAVTGHVNGKERYEAYCIFVFNLLMTGFKHFGEDGDKLEEYLGVEEIVRCHRKWWLHDRENLGYDEPFRFYIQKVIDKLRREGKIE